MNEIFFNASTNLFKMLLKYHMLISGILFELLLQPVLTIKSVLHIQESKSFYIQYFTVHSVKFCYSVLSFLTDVQDPRAVVVLTPVKLLVFDLLSSSAKYVGYSIYCTLKVLVIYLILFYGYLRTVLVGLQFSSISSII